VSDARVTRVEYRFGRFGATPRARLLALSLRMTVRPVGARLPLSPVSVRSMGVLAEVGASVLRPPRGTWIEPVRLPGFTAEWVRARRVPISARAVLYLHGGGFLLGSARTHRGLVARLSAAADAPVLAINYRHPPQVPLSATVDDCVTAYRWLLDQGFASQRIVIAGDSAGGNLVFATVLKARELGLAPPAGLVGLSSCFDLTLSGETIRANARCDPFLPASALIRFVQFLCDGHDAADPGLSPLYADLTGLPPVLLQVGSTEVLRSDSERMAYRLTQAGVGCVLQVWERQVHVFQGFAPFTREALAAIREVGLFIGQVTAGATMGDS